MDRVSDKTKFVSVPLSTLLDWAAEAEERDNLDLRAAINKVIRAADVKCSECEHENNDADPEHRREPCNTCSIDDGYPMGTMFRKRDGCARCEELKSALGESARSLEAIAGHAGNDPHLQGMNQVCEYARSRANATRAALQASGDFTERELEKAFLRSAMAYCETEYVLPEGVEATMALWNTMRDHYTRLIAHRAAKNSKEDTDA